VTSLCKDVDPSLPCSAANTTAFIERLVSEAKPNLVVFMGDQVHAPQRPASALAAVWDPVVAANIPFVFLFGDHDV